MSSRLRARLTLLLTLFLFCPEIATAQFSGTWQAGRLSIRHATSSWGPDCPGRLPATASEPGGSVTISQSGDNLSFSGAVSGSSGRCWGENPALRRISSTYSAANGWTIVCRTPPSDSRTESATYRIRASEDGSTLTFTETTEWDWELNDSRCAATRRGRRNFTRHVETPEPAEPERPSCTPGAPAGVRLSPRQANAAPGERICFSARVIDASACTVPGQRLNFTLDGGPSQRCFAAPTATGEHRVAVNSGDFRATASLVVSSSDMSDLIARQESSGTVGPGAEAQGGDASGMAASTTQSSSWHPLIFVMGGLCLMGLVFFFVAKKRKSENSTGEQTEKNSGAETPGPAAVPRALVKIEGPLRQCPACGRRYEREIDNCEDDGAPLLDLRSEAVIARGKICPTCRTGYSFDVTNCSKDGSELVPYAFFEAQKKHEKTEKNTCPTCGNTFNSNVKFCPNDRTRLG